MPIPKAEAEPEEKLGEENFRTNPADNESEAIFKTLQLKSAGEYLGGNRNLKNSKLA